MHYSLVGESKLCILHAWSMYKYASHQCAACYVIRVGVRATCIPVGGIVGLHEIWLEHYPYMRALQNSYLLFPLLIYFTRALV